MALAAGQATGGRDARTHTQMTIVTDDNTATPGGGPAEGAVERALAAAIRDAGRIGDLLDELSRGRLWLPLPDDGPVTDGSAVHLPTLTYLGASFVPAFTSAARLRESIPRPRTPAGGVYLPAPVKPHVVVAAAALARRLPADVGIALNPGAGESVPVYPEGVRYLASASAADPRRRISVGPLPGAARRPARRHPRGPGGPAGRPRRRSRLAVGRVRRRGTRHLGDAR